MIIKGITEQNPSLGDIVFIIKQSQTVLPFVAIQGESPNVIEYHSLLPGIIFDTRVGLVRGYSFGWWLSLCVLGIVFDTYDYGGVQAK